MDKEAIERQIEAIKAAGEKARSSKEAAHKFLTEAGIIPYLTDYKKEPEKK